MEAYFIASGVKHELDLFESIMQSQPFYLPVKNSKGKEIGKQPYYGILAPIKLYKYVFPKESLNEVIKMLKFNKPDGYPQFDKQAFFLRKVMKAKMFPKIPEDTPERFFPKNLHLALKPIGFKEDKEISYDGITHEAI